MSSVEESQNELETLQGNLQVASAKLKEWLEDRSNITQKEYDQIEALLEDTENEVWEMQEKLNDLEIINET